MPGPGNAQPQRRADAAPRWIAQHTNTGMTLGQFLRAVKQGVVDHNQLVFAAKAVEIADPGVQGRLKGR